MIILKFLNKWVYNYNYLFYYICILNNKNFYIYLKYFCKNIKIEKNNTFNYLIIFKKNYFQKLFYLNKSIKNKIINKNNNSLNNVLNSKKLIFYYLKTFKFLCFNVLINYKNLTIKELKNKNYLHKSYPTILFFLKKLKIMDKGLFKYKVSLIKNYSKTFFSQILKNIVYKKHLKYTIKNINFFTK